MKAQLLVEGTPDELMSLLALMEGKPAAATPQLPLAEARTGLPSDVDMVVTGRGATNRNLHLVRSYLQGVIAHTYPIGEEQRRLFSLRVGAKQRSEDGLNDYVRLHMIGIVPTVGYLRPRNGQLKLRLPASILSGQIYSQPRQAKDRDTFGIQILLTSEEAVQEALRFLDKIVQWYLFREGVSD